MFKDKLRKLREEKGLSQYELADKIYVSRSAIAKWENGFGMPGKESLEILCDFFGVTKEFLLEEDEPIKIIENVNKRSRKVLILVSAILIPLVLYFIVSISIYTFIKLDRAQFEMQEGVFYKNSYLKKFDLRDLEMIDSSSYGLIGRNSPTFTAQISSYDVFDNYVNYVYNKLLFGPEFTYLSYGYRLYDIGFKEGPMVDYYLTPSSSIENHIVEINKDTSLPTTYEFYFLNDFDQNRIIQSEVEVSYIRLYYYKEYKIDENNNKSYNHIFKMTLKKKKISKYSEKHYLISDYFDVKKIKIINDNILNYLVVEQDRSITFAGINNNNVPNPKYPRSTFDLFEQEKYCKNPYTIFVKVEFKLTQRYESTPVEEMTIVKICKIENNISNIYITDKDIGADPNDDVNQLQYYEIEVDYEVLDNSYYYELSLK